MEFSWTVDRAGDASLVRCRVRNDGAATRRVRVESEFDAPVLPPRRAGVPADGWDASGVTLRVDPGERRGFGFAAPAPPVDPPVAIADVGPVDASDLDGSARDVAGGTGNGRAAVSTPAAALRELAEHRPPRAAVAGDRALDGRAEDTAAGGDDRDSDGDVGEAEKDDDAEDEDDTEDDDAEDEDDTEDDDAEDEDGAPARPDRASIDDWFAAVEARIDRAERLTDADVATATEVVANAGGVDALAELDDRLDDDAERLRAVSERAASLAERATESDIPVDALERLA